MISGNMWKIEPNVQGMKFQEAGKLIHHSIT